MDNTTAQQHAAQAGAGSLNDLRILLKAIIDGDVTLTAGDFVTLSINSVQVTATAADLNILDGVTATAGELNILDDTVATVDIALAASATTDGMDITITMLDAAGNAIDAVHQFEWWISEAATGIGLTADSYSGDVTTVTGTEVEEITAKKRFTALTDASGVFGALAVASANPTDQYIAVRHPVSGKVIVSAASGTNWEGA